jgi:hypothetical protein
MGKTGSTTIQKSLAENRERLAAAGIRYLGQWMDLVDPAFDHFAGFQGFLRQPDAGKLTSAQRFLGGVDRLHRDSGADTFIVSNEQYLENLPRLAEFFKVIAAQVQLQIIIFVRPPASWLPSAYVQWGVVHKTNRGPVQPFGVKARQLMRQYDFIPQWRQSFGDRVTVRPFDETLDVVQDFAGLIGVDIPSNPARQQVRSGTTETILRAVCNNAFPDAAMPELFNALRPPRGAGRMPMRLSEKFSFLFDRQEIPRIIAENLETLTAIERDFGIDLISAAGAEPETFDLPDLTNDLIGTMLDLVFSQAHQINDLRARLETLERQNDRK